MGGTRAFYPISRRSFLTGGLALCGVAPTALRSALALAADVKFQTNPFTLGVASGDPDSDSVVLWTRLAPDPVNGGGMPRVDVEVTWQVADDEKMTRLVRRGRTLARPEWAHSVHVEAEGLEAGRWYWYQFQVGNELSPVGRTRTLPRQNDATDRLRFAFVSCQNYELGYFTAYDHIASEDLDLVFHLGDYIYEGRGTPNRARSLTGPELTTLAQYRDRYAIYKTDPDLQKAHAAFPWIVTWDDHEVADNYAGLITERNDPVDIFRMRRAAAYRAYYEHMPLRQASRPKDWSARLYRGFSYGSLASFFVLDTRQYRTDQPCGDRMQPMCPGARDERATMLGSSQERWLTNGLDRSRARWNVMPQQVMMAKVDGGSGAQSSFSMDQWPGYEAGQKRLIDFLAARRPSNPVVLTGDIHSHWVNDLHTDFSNAKSPVVATELVGTSITSDGDGVDALDVFGTIAGRNPFVKFYNGQRGYVACEVTPKTMRAEFRVLDYVTRPGSPKHTRAVFVIEDGRPGAQRERG
jgi:alkaline phosphatase D